MLARYAYPLVAHHKEEWSGQRRGS